MKNKELDNRPADSVDPTFVEADYQGLDSLEPCPYCGSLDLHMQKDGDAPGEWFMICIDCRCKGPREKKRGLALEYWNARIHELDGVVLPASVYRRIFTLLLTPEAWTENHAIARADEWLLLLEWMAENIPPDLDTPDIANMPETVILEGLENLPVIGGSWQIEQDTDVMQQIMHTLSLELSIQVMKQLPRGGGGLAAYGLYIIQLANQLGETFEEGDIAYLELVRRLGAAAVGCMMQNGIIPPNLQAQKDLIRLPDTPD